MEHGCLSRTRPGRDGALPRPGPPDEEALLERWEPMVRHLARLYGHAADREDLEQVARLALVKAARRFDPARGCQFGTYAVPTIVGCLRHYLRDQALLRGVPRRWWELHGRLHPERESAAQALGREPTVAELAERLGVSEEELVGAMAVPDLCRPRSLDEPVAAAAGEEPGVLVDLLGRTDPRIEAVELREVLRPAIEQLPERLREIVQRRYFQGQSQQQVARALGVCQMQVSRLERRALGALRGTLGEALGEAEAQSSQQASAPEPLRQRPSREWSTRMRKAIVMAGGPGTRLWPLTAVRPKPLVRVANRPVLVYLLEWLRRHGVVEVLLTLHYRADDICRAVGDGRSFGLRLTYQVEEEPLGTAGAVKQAEAWVAGEPFLVISGDALTDLDLDALGRRHRQRGAWVTLALAHVADPCEYGVVERDDGGRITRFQEKPAPGQAFSHLVNTGIYCVEPQVLQWVPAGRACDWSRDLFPRLLAHGLPLGGQLVAGYWQDIGSLAAYRRAQRDALEGAVRVALPGTEARPEVWLEPEVEIAPGAIVEGPVLLGAGCRIERGARVLAGSVLGASTLVRSGACVRGAVLGEGCEIGPGSVVYDGVLDDAVRLGRRCEVMEGAVVGFGAWLAPGARVGAKQRVGPGEMLADSEEPEGAVDEPTAAHKGTK